MSSFVFHLSLLTLQGVLSSDENNRPGTILSSNIVRLHGFTSYISVPKKVNNKKKLWILWIEEKSSETREVAYI